MNAKFEKVKILDQALLAAKWTASWVPQVRKIVEEGTQPSMVAYRDEEVIEARVGESAILRDESTARRG